MDREAIFYRLTNLSNQIKALGGIVQSEGSALSEDRLLEWSSEVDSNIVNLLSIKEDVLQYFEEGEYL